MVEKADIKQKFCAVILAGDRGAEDPVARAAGLSRKCLVPVAGVPMLVRVVAALTASPWIGDIAVVIEEPELLQGLEGLRPHLHSGRLRALPAAARCSPRACLCRGSRTAVRGGERRPRYAARGPAPRS